MARSSILRPGDERGVAMVIALLVLLVISVLVVVLMVTVNVDTKITSHGLRETEALNNAEAGIGEAQSRIAAGDIVLGGNPLAVAQIFNVASGSVPVLGTDSTGFATAQPAGAWLAYSTATRGPNVLTVQYKTDNARTVVYKYDAAKNPAVQTLSGSPIYVITSTGTAGGDVRRVRAEIYARPVIANVFGALQANVGVHTKGTFDACGLNHRADTPVGDSGDSYHTGSDDLAGIWSTSVITHQGASTSDGNPPDLAGQTGFYAGPWDVFGLTQAQFFSWVGPPVSSPPDPANGIYYVDQDVAYHGGSGSGLLYVEGDLTINAGFNYTGVIYVKGDVKINGHAWILGAMIVEGTVDITLANGTAQILYSSDAISQALSTADGSFQRLSWRELP
jgi:Tfp pilus assembly protein PilX